MTTDRKSALIVGASIAGPVAAYWLAEAGFDVTIVEKAPAVRGGGYPIDIRGAALEVIDRMGLSAELRSAHVDTRRITFLHPDGSTIAALDAQDVRIGVGDDLEVRRGDLTRVLTDAVPGRVEWRFDDSIRSVASGRNSAHVVLQSGDEVDVDVVLGADGIHSRTRRLVFGPEEGFQRYLGSCYAGFSVPNSLGLAHEGVIWNVPGRAAALYAVRNDEQIHGLLSLTAAQPDRLLLGDPAGQRELLRDAFAGAGWIVPDLLATAFRADDLFFDTVSQARVDRWSDGRVGIIGDAAHAPSFLTGQGTSLAITGAYVAARELATKDSVEAALSAYEARMRPFAVANQDLVDGGDPPFFPSTPESLRERNEFFANLRALPPEEPDPVHSAIDLSPYV